MPYPLVREVRTPLGTCAEGRSFFNDRIRALRRVTTERGRLSDPSARDARGADADPPALAPIVQHLHGLEVRQPASPRLVVRVAHPVPASGSLSANLTASCHLDRPSASVWAHPVRSTSSISAISAASPFRCPSFRIRVYPPGLSRKRGPMSSKSFPSTALSWMRRAARRRACRSPRRASVMSLSANGRSSLALAVVVLTRPWRKRLVARFLKVARRWEDVLVSFRPFVRCRMSVSFARPIPIYSSPVSAGSTAPSSSRKYSCPSPCWATRIPKRRLCCARKSWISCRDFLPKFSISSISSSER